MCLVSKRPDVTLILFYRIRSFAFEVAILGKKKKKNGAKRHRVVRIQTPL